MALLYFTGDGVEQSYEKAAELWEASQELAESNYCLASLYAKGTSHKHMHVNART